MFGTDMMSVNSGSGTCVDRWSTGHTTPAADGSNDCTYTSSVSGGDTIHKLRRALDTGDGDDTAIEAGEITAMYAGWGSGNIASHSGYGFFDIKVAADGSSVEVGDIGGDPYKLDDYELHGYGESLLG